MAHKAKRLTCPKCGWDGADDGKFDACFRLVEQIVTERRVEGFNTRGKLEVSSEDQVTVEDTPAARRLRCGDCQHEFPVPDGVEVEFV